MPQLRVSVFVVAGLLLWGLPGIFAAGPIAIILTLAVALPVWLIDRIPDSSIELKGALPGRNFALLICLTLAFLTYDVIWGRQMLSSNLFISGVDAIDKVIESTNEHVSEGRGVADLLGSLLIFLPFSLIDLSRQIPKLQRFALWITASLYLFNEVGIGRAFVLTALLSIAIGSTRSLEWKRLVLAGGLAVGGFAFASLFRGDFNTVQFSNPLFDAVAFPFINLKLMLASGCSNGQWYEFVGEFFKKFIPAFVFPKQIFSFNVEMTLCIYPFLGNSVNSVSVFTYLGEFFYYRPSILTALAAGALLGSFSRFVDRRMVAYQLHSARIFVGLMCIVFLRSRILDVLSFMLSLLIFLFLWPRLIATTRAGLTPVAKAELSKL